MGFVPVGVYSRVGFKSGSWHDVIWLQLRLSDAPVPQGDPYTTAGLFEDESVLAFLHECAQTAKMD
jgi:phosphinothricin acetyltransferase